MEIRHRPGAAAPPRTPAAGTARAGDGDPAPPADASLECAALIERLGAAESVYRRLRALAVEHGRVLESGDAGSLMRVARAKEAELERLEGIERGMRSYKACWERFRDRLDARERESVQRAVARLEEVLRGLLAVEAEHEQALRRREEAALDGVRRLEAGRRMRRAYEPAAAEAPPSLDRSE